jgi:hypothetical protein
MFFEASLFGLYNELIDLIGNSLQMRGEHIGLLIFDEASKELKCLRFFVE